MGRRVDEVIDVRLGALAVVSHASPLSELLRRPAVVVRGDCTVARAAGIMERASVSALLVEEPAGIVTERDLARALAHGGPADGVVAAIMTPHPVTVPASTTVLDAATLMLNEQVRHLVIETDGSRGVLSLRDVAAVLLQSATPQLWLASLRVAVDAPAETWLG